MAIDLRAGDRLQLLNGEYVVIEQIQHELLESPVTVYNFEVEGFHTYYVTDSAIWVHNLCGKDSPNLHDGKGRIPIPEDAQMIRQDKANVNSNMFKDFVRSQGLSFRSSEWKYTMETWELSDGTRIERHYWHNRVTHVSFYHD